MRIDAGEGFTSFAQRVTSGASGEQLRGFGCADAGNGFTQFGEGRADTCVQRAGQQRAQARAGFRFGFVLCGLCSKGIGADDLIEVKA